MSHGKYYEYQNSILNYNKEINDIHELCKNLGIVDFTNDNPIVQDLLIAKAIPQISAIVNKLLGRESSIDIEIIQTEEELTNSISAINNSETLLERLHGECDEFQKNLKNHKPNSHQYNVFSDSLTQISIFRNFFEQIFMYKEHVDNLLYTYANHLMERDNGNYQKLHKLLDILSQWISQTTNNFNILEKYYVYSNTIQANKKYAIEQHYTQLRRNHCESKI